MRLLVYVSSPYSSGDQAANVRSQIDVGHELMDRGHSVILPNLTHFMQIVKPREYEDWLAMDEQPNVHVIQVIQTEAAVAKLVELVRKA